MKLYYIQEGFPYNSEYEVHKAFTTKAKATNYLRKTLGLKENTTYDYWEVKSKNQYDGRWWRIKNLEVVE